MADAALQEWLDSRRSLITASDCAAILNENPYCKREKIKQEKLQDDRENLDDKPRIQAGNYLEEGIWNWFLSKIPGAVGHYNRERKIFCSPVLPYLAATPDAFLVTDAKIPCEIKNTSAGQQWQKVPSSELCVPAETAWCAESFLVPKGDLCAPSYYMVQLRVQMHVLDAPYGYLAALISGQGLYWLKYTRDVYWENNVLLPRIREFRDELAREGLVL